jgi:hypothetical protein
MCSAEPLQVVSGVSLPENTLLVIANERYPARVPAVDKATVDIIAQVDIDRLAIGQRPGGAYTPTTNTLFAIDWSQNE